MIPGIPWVTTAPSLQDNAFLPILDSREASSFSVQHSSKRTIADIITAGRRRTCRHNKVTHLMARLTSTITSDSGSIASRTSRKPSRVPILATKASHLLRPARSPCAAESGAWLVKAIVFSLLITSTLREDTVPTFNILVVQCNGRRSDAREVRILLEYDGCGALTLPHLVFNIAGGGLLEQ